MESVSATKKPCTVISSTSASSSSSWEDTLVLKVLNPSLLEYFNVSPTTDVLACRLLDLLIELLRDYRDAKNTLVDCGVNDGDEKFLLDLSATNIIQSFDRNIAVIKLCHQLSRSKEDSYKILVALDESLTDGSIEVIFKREEIAEAHAGLSKSEWRGYNVIHFSIFLALAKCKMWPRLFKEIRAGRKNERIWTIHTFFDAFR